MNRPQSLAALRTRLRVYGRKHGISIERMQQLVTIAEVMKMLPEGTALKGGNSLTARFPISKTRFSADLDLILSTDEDSWEQEFNDNLRKGDDSFTGYVKARGHDKSRTHHHVPSNFQMWPRDVHLSYDGRSFSRLPLDVTPQFTYLEPVVEPTSPDLLGMMRDLGFDIPFQREYQNPVEQISDKATTLYYADRPQDLYDLTILDPDLALGVLFPQEISHEMIRSAKEKGIDLVLSEKRANLLCDEYVSSGFGTYETAVNVISAIDASVQRELKIEQIQELQIRTSQSHNLRKRHSPRL